MNRKTVIQWANLDHIRVSAEASPNGQQVKRASSYFNAVPESATEDVPVVREVIEGDGEERLELVGGAVVVGTTFRRIVSHSLAARMTRLD